MVRKVNEKPPIVPKVFSSAEIEPSITKLRRRIEDVEKLKVERTRFDDQRVSNTEHAIHETVRVIFGANSPEFDRYKNHDIWHGGYNLMEDAGARQQKFLAGIDQTVIMLKGLIDIIQEKQAELGFDPAVKAKATLGGLDMHPRVLSACKDRYDNGHYVDAVFNASKALVNFVKEKSGKYDLDGSALMTTVFSKDKPILCFNDLSDQTDKDEQQGLMHLFLGMVLGIRNPRGHQEIYDSSERAMEYLCFLSLLANRLDETKLA